MNEKVDVINSSSIWVLYAIVAVSGGLGGCAAGCYYLTHEKRPRWAFAVSYMVLGMVFGVITFAILASYHFDVDSIHKLILYSLLGGTCGAVMLASANMTVRLLFRKLGVEIQLTMKKTGEENRRDGDDDS